MEVCRGAAANERRLKSGGKQSVCVQLFEVVAKLSTAPQSPLILHKSLLSSAA